MGNRSQEDACISSQFHCSCPFGPKHLQSIAVHGYFVIVVVCLENIIKIWKLIMILNHIITVQTVKIYQNKGIKEEHTE